MVNIDEMEMAKFISEQIKLPIETVTKVLDAEFEYLKLLGLVGKPRREKRGRGNIVK